LIPKAYPPVHRNGTDSGGRLGADVGATLAKLALRRPDGELALRVIPSDAIEAVAREIEALKPERIGLTGGGASRLAGLLSARCTTADEFEAWAAGARSLLRQASGSVPERFLLVSLGTGTSAMLVDADRSVRVGGTALGGGTLAGLGAVLVGTSDFDDLARLARAGDRRRVDLLVGDIYANGELPLPRDVNAASFAKLARPAEAAARDRRDVAHALVGLVGENVALICGGLAAAAGVENIAYGGTTLRNNPALTEILQALAPVHACRATFLPDGEFTGALGALELAASAGG